jgi:hypothetical protein
MGVMWKEPRPVPAVVLVGLITAAGLLAGCGGVKVNEPPATPGSGASATSAPATVPAGPMTITLIRSGGIAGVHETVVIDASGDWTYTDQRKAQSQKGTFTPAQLAQLAQLATDPRLAEEVRGGGSTSVCNDAFQYMLTIGGQMYRFEDCGQSRPAVQAILGVIAGATPL